MSSPSDAAAFMAAIRERPDDPVPWLVFADWLAERGNALELNCRHRADRLTLLRPGRGIRERRREFDRRWALEGRRLNGETPAHRWLTWEDPETTADRRVRLFAGHCAAAGNPRPFIGALARLVATALEAEPGPAFWDALRLCEDYASGQDVTSRLGAATAALGAEESARLVDLDSLLTLTFDYSAASEILCAVGSADPIASILSRLDFLGWTSVRHNLAAQLVLPTNPFPPPC